MESDELSRRELLRRGLITGGTAAAFGLMRSTASAATADGGESPSSAGVSLGLAPEWPWGATLDPEAPFYLSPGPELPGASAFPIPIGFSRPLLVVPLFVSVSLGRPPVVRPPFDVRVVATGDGLDADSVTLDVPFVKHSPEQETSGSRGRVLARRWLGVFPVVFEPGAFELQATIQAASEGAAASASRQLAGSTDSSLTIEGDFSEAPVTTSLPSSAQTDLVATFSSQQLADGFSIQDLFDLVNTATISARAKLLEIRARTSAISIADMFGMQMLTHHLSDLEEASTQIVSVVNTAITSMARNVKG